MDWEYEGADDRVEMQRYDTSAFIVGCFRGKLQAHQLHYQNLIQSIVDLYSASILACFVNMYTLKSHVL